MWLLDGCPQTIGKRLPSLHPIGRPTWNFLFFGGPGLRAYRVAFDTFSSQTSSCADQFEGHLAPNQMPRKWRLVGRPSLRPWIFGFEARSSEKVAWGWKTENKIKRNVEILVYNNYEKAPQRFFLNSRVGKIQLARGKKFSRLENSITFHSFCLTFF